MTLHSKVLNCPTTLRMRCPLPDCPFHHRIYKDTNTTPPMMSHGSRAIDTMPFLYPPTLRFRDSSPPSRFPIAGVPQIPGVPFSGLGLIAYRYALAMQTMQTGTLPLHLLGREFLPQSPYPTPMPQPLPQLPQTQQTVGSFRPKKLIPCLFFANGGCAYGDACYFIHDDWLCDLQPQEFGGRKINGTVYYPLPPSKPQSPPPVPKHPQPSFFSGISPDVVRHVLNGGPAPDSFHVVPNYSYTTTPPAISDTTNHLNGIPPTVPPATPVLSDAKLPLNGVESGNVLAALSNMVVNDMRSLPHRPSASISNVPVRKGHVRRISVAVKSEAENAANTEQVGGRPVSKRRHGKSKSLALGPTASFKFP
ncbi:hypothetical protein OF83DRAFT_1176952 [Amylostereum chailletii]|nr:hypothetical protein OF83DRAFT_1176952 [Amylostereum chailletii]